MDLGFDIDEHIERLAKVPKLVRLGVVVGLLVAVAAGYYTTSYQSSRLQVDQLRAEAQQLQRKLNKVRVVASNLGDFEQEVAGLERDLNEALRQLPNRKQFEDLLRDISTAGKKVGIEVKGIRREKELEHDFYAEVPFLLELDGGYHEIAQFFERLSKLSRIVNVGALNIKANGRGEGSTLRVGGTATTFRFLMEAGDETASITLPMLSDDSERA